MYFILSSSFASDSTTFQQPITDWMTYYTHMFKQCIHNLKSKATYSRRERGRERKRERKREKVIEGEKEGEKEREARVAVVAR